MDHPSKRRRVERNLGGPVEGLNLSNGRERSVSLVGSSQNEKPIMPKLVLPPHGAPGHPAHGDQPIDASSQDVDRPHYPLESADTKPTRVHARQIVQSSVESTAPKTSDAMSLPSGTPTSKADDNSYPGQVEPPAGVAAEDARNQALQSQQAQAVAVKQLDAIPQAPAPASANHAAASTSPKAVDLPDSSSQQIVKAPSTPSSSNPSPTPNSSASYFSASPASSPSPSPQHKSSPSAPSPTFTPNKQDIATNYNGTMSASTTTSSNPSTLSSESGTMSLSFLALPTASQSSLASISAMMASISDATNPSASLQNLASGTGTSSHQITSTPTTLFTSTSTPALSQLSSQASIASVTSSASAAGVGGHGNSGNTAPTSSSSNGGSGGSGAPPTQDLVGGIVGGVAGLAMIFVILLLLLRWRRGKLGNRRTISPPVPQTIGHGGMPQSGNMTQRSSTAPIAAAGFFRSLRPTSSQTATTVETAPSERGFQKISGRKLTSVLASGGDGWGEPPAAGPTAGPTGPTAGPTGPIAGLGMAAGVAKGPNPFDDPPPGQRPSPPHSLSGSSFYHDSHGFYGGVVPEEQTEGSSSPGSSSSPTYFAPLGAAAGRSHAPLGHGSPSRRAEAAQMRPGPARTPVINQPGFGSIRGGAPPRPVRATPPPAGLHPVRDGVGRSHPSQDGSRGSRFREDTTPP